MKSWSIEDIVKWSKDTFPKLTLKSQKIKFLEEYKEWLESGDKMEMADMYIVNTVLCSRFDFWLFNEIYDAECGVVPKKEINKKMEINSKRVWVFKNGVYHHKGEKE